MQGRVRGRAQVPNVYEDGLASDETSRTPDSVKTEPSHYRQLPEGRQLNSLYDPKARLPFFSRTLVLGSYAFANDSTCVPALHWGGGGGGGVGGVD
jgi:hypothetical protein